ncbi:anti-repressor SinI family protein [Salipaludibacillus sp. LMS25]|jgi:DNA-binding transcriptional MerR regulator|uniref:anti-repressor SinI family protein n=1 Tax=Salipaludibacillus sp. LMS25 TaxID=2924031 RepID=UPI0020D13D3A|nr:anti-repressor SinI family protein [Salipaludibacillus sp. LMS25]UTR13612.1 anti-repressor SinI family protein [Salipaludibacillus sp. LMS25]
MDRKLHSTLDREWERLIREARQRGLTPHDVRQFLEEKRQEKHAYGIKQASGDNS